MYHLHTHKTHVLYLASDSPYDTRQHFDYWSYNILYTADVAE